jgi:hypothetical protein
MSGPFDFITLQVHLHNETALAFCVSPMLGSPQIWVPKSLVELGQPTEAGGWLIRVPIWLARSKGLVTKRGRRSRRERERI